MQGTRRTFMLGAAAALVAGRAQGQAWDVLQISGRAFGAGWQVRVPYQAGGGADPQTIALVVAECVASVDNCASPFRAGSELSAFNGVQDKDWIAASPMMLHLVGRAKRIAELTDGAFDPTVGGIVGQYGFGPITTPQAGSFADLALSKTAIRKAHPAQTLDLCAIAKGHALDLIADALDALGQRDFFVELGGEVTARGHHPEGRLWQAGIERPTRDAAPVPPEMQQIVSIKGEALATSGDRVNGYGFGDRRYCHIIDPHSHRPAQSALASVSVFSPHAITADALATALFAMGPERGIALAESARIAALFITREAGSLRSHATHDFKARIPDRNPDLTKG